MKITGKSVSATAWTETAGNGKAGVTSRGEVFANSSGKGSAAAAGLTITKRG